MNDPVLWTIVAGTIAILAFPAFGLWRSYASASHIDALEAAAAILRANEPSDTADLKARAAVAQPDLIVSRDGTTAIVTRENGEVMWSGTIGHYTGRPLDIPGLRARAATAREGLARARREGA